MRVAGIVFDALFNLDKFIQFEQRDPFAERQKRDDPFDCDWDRFAYSEYNRLAQEEEAREALAEYQKLLLQRQKEEREKRQEKISQRRSNRSSRASEN